MEVIGDADAAFGDIVPECWNGLKGSVGWPAPRGPRAGYYTRELIESDFNGHEHPRNI